MKVTDRAVDYVIVSASSLDDLQNKMQEFLGRDSASAWCPIAAPVFQKDSSGSWHQAVCGFPKEYAENT